MYELLRQDVRAAPKIFSGANEQTFTSIGKCTGANFKEPRPLKILFMTEKLQGERIAIDQQIKDSLKLGDEFRFSKLVRAKDELNQREYFLTLQDKRARLAGLVDDRDTAQMVRDDVQDQLRTSGALISGIREKLEAAEGEHRSLTAKLFALDGVIDSNRRAIAELKRDIEQQVNEKLKEVTQ